MSVIKCVCVQSWHAIIVDGHSVEELCKALSQPRHQPTAIIAKTIKGKGIPGNWLLHLLYKIPHPCSLLPLSVVMLTNLIKSVCKVQHRFHLFSAAEDKLGWHAKALPKDMAEMVIKDLQSRIMSSSKHLYPPPPTEDSPPASLRNIRMPSAPNYKAGEKVFHLYIAKTRFMSSISIFWDFLASQTTAAIQWILETVD